MTTIANTTDFLRLLREDPEFRAEVRRELQIQELLELPGKFAAFAAQTQQEFSDVKTRLGGLEEAVAGLQEAVAQLQETVARQQITIDGILVTLARMDGRIGRLEGSEYERHVSRILMGPLSRALRGLRRGRLMHSAAYGTTSEFSEMMEGSVDADKITDDQWYEIQRADAVVRGVKGGSTVYVVAEMSLTVHQRDIDRAAERAAIMRQATGATAYPVVVGDSVPPPQLAQASGRNVTVIIIQQQGD